MSAYSLHSLIAITFCMFILYLVSLLISLIVVLGVVFGSRFFGIFYVIMSCENRGSFFFLSNLYPLHFFLLPRYMTRVSSTMLRRSNESGHPCLLLVSGEAFGFSQLSMLDIDVCRFFF